jgi:hypothetical protein
MYTVAQPAAKPAAESLSTKPNVVIVKPKMAKRPIVKGKTDVDTEKANPR